MSQLTLRMSEQLVSQLKTAARAQGHSLNKWATTVLSAAVDPAFAGDEAQALRERLARAGILLSMQPTSRRRPARAALARARAAAGRGRRLSGLVLEDRR